MSQIPPKGKYDVTVTCDRGATAIWNEDTWSITIYNATKTGTRCSVSFVTNNNYKDGTGASRPELYAGLIPIKYDTSNNIVVADTTTEWYNYANHEWANAILINQSNASIKNKYINSDGSFKAGTIVSVNDILQMYVWIPRYKYKLFNVSGATTSAQMIDIAFESNITPKSSGTQNGEWLTHPAFTFGETELNGIWVGKFESSNNTSDIKIVPNISSLRETNISTMFNASRAIESNAKYGLDASTVDTHMMKNMEWGAVAYLTNSKYGRYIDANTCIATGCEVWVNNNSNYITGCAGSSTSAGLTSACNAWTTSYGVNASTTGNTYGIYDMSGGAWEFVMGTMQTSTGAFYPASTGFTQAPENKYYDSYIYGDGYNDYSRGHLGDATKETNGWYGDLSGFLFSTYPWFRRGGIHESTTESGIFYFDATYGSGDPYKSFRIVLTQN